MYNADISRVIALSETHQGLMELFLVIAGALAVEALFLDDAIIRLLTFGHLGLFWLAHQQLTLCE